jgi:DNA (cytosine-5)-methyltransferase 1
LNNKLKVLDLFSGIGGFSLGLHSTGIFDTVKFVEFDKFCQKVLQKNFKNIPIEGDIRNVKGQEFEADVITGGFPCQPFSVAGKQKGTDDNRYLWPEMFRLIKEIKPEFVIGENVQGLINLQDGMVLRQVQDQLEGEGFEVQCFLIPASGIGAWHQRNRVWIIGHSKHNGLLASEKRSRDKKIDGGTQKGQNKTIESERTNGSTNNGNVSNTIGTGSRGEDSRNFNEQGRITTKTKRKSIQPKDGKACSNDIKSDSSNVSYTSSELSDGCSSPTRDSEKEFIRLECNEGWDWQKIRSKVERCSEQAMANTETKRLQRRSISTDLEGSQRSSNDITETSTEEQYTWWQTQSNLCGVPDGISRELDKDRSNRIKSLGNAIVPQCARILGLAIKQVLIEEDRL